MESNVCDVNHLDAEFLLPPRKRLLVGFKRQNSDIDVVVAAAASNQHPPPPPPPPVVVASSSSSSSSTSHLSLPYVSPISLSSIEFQTRLNDLLSSHFSDSQDLSPEQIVEASKSVADAVVKIAEATRAAAHEKALLAAKAVAVAKDALALIASFPPEEGAASATTAKGNSSRERNLKKYKLKKHMQVQLLYKKHQPVEISGNDEQLACKLHAKNSLDLDLKVHKNMKLKIWPSAEMSMKGIQPSTGKLGNVVAGVLDYEGMQNGEAKMYQQKKRRGGEATAGSTSKRRGRLKLKKLPLSTCNLRREANPENDHNPPRASPLTDKNMENHTTTSCNTSTSHLKSLFPVEPSSTDDLRPMEIATLWKCQLACVLAE